MAQGLFFAIPCVLIALWGLIFLYTLFTITQDALAERRKKSLFVTSSDLEDIIARHYKG